MKEKMTGWFIGTTNVNFGILIPTWIRLNSTAYLNISLGCIWCVWEIKSFLPLELLFFSPLLNKYPDFSVTIRFRQLFWVPKSSLGRTLVLLWLVSGIVNVSFQSNSVEYIFLVQRLEPRYFLHRKPVLYTLRGIGVV